MVVGRSGHDRLSRSRIPRPRRTCNDCIGSLPCGRRSTSSFGRASHPGARPSFTGPRHRCGCLQRKCCRYSRHGLPTRPRTAYLRERRWPPCTREVTQLPRHGGSILPCPGGLAEGSAPTDLLPRRQKVVNAHSTVDSGGYNVISASGSATGTTVQFGGAIDLTWWPR
jgi:hypothetical protein